MSKAVSVSEYLAAVEQELQSGVATEHTYRPALKRLVERISDARATNEPKRSACGAPDYSVWQLTGDVPTTLGYIEAKDVGVPLASAEESEQILRYRAALTNLVLTDYLEFRWYVTGSGAGRRALAFGVSTVGSGGIAEASRGYSASWKISWHKSRSAFRGRKSSRSEWHG